MKFGYATVKGTWYNEPASGIFTASSEYEDSASDLEIYENLKKRARIGRKQHWGSDSSFDIVTSAAILPGEINQDDYSTAVMNIESWWDREGTTYGAEAIIPIVGTVRTLVVFLNARQEAVRMWRQEHPHTSLGYVAVGAFNLLETDFIAVDILRDPTE